MGLFPLLPPLMDPSLLPLASPFTETLTIMAEVEEGGGDAVEDTQEEVFADIIITVVTATDDFSEPTDELQSPSVHSDASSGSDPDPHPEEEDDEEQENEEEEGGHTEEFDLSILPSTRTLLQLVLLSVLPGEPEDQGEGSYCESKPGCSRPVCLGEWLTESRMGAMPVQVACECNSRPIRRLSLARVENG